MPSPRKASAPKKRANSWDDRVAIIADAYKRAYPDLSTRSIGVASAPIAGDYVVVAKDELPVFDRPSFTSGTGMLTIFGLARAGDYFPVVEERHVAFIENPLSRSPSSNGKWVKVTTALGESGWLMAERSPSHVIAKIVHQPALVTATPDAPTALFPSLVRLVGTVIAVGVVVALVVVIVRLGAGGAGGGGRIRGAGGAGRLSSTGRIGARRSAVPGRFGRRSRIYKSTGLIEREVGRQDEKGNTYDTTGLMQKKVERRDEKGNIYDTTGLFEKKVRREDEEGNIYDTTGLFEKKVGRRDEKGNIYDTTGLFEKKVGRIEEKN